MYLWLQRFQNRVAHRAFSNIEEFHSWNHYLISTIEVWPIKAEKQKSPSHDRAFSFDINGSQTWTRTRDLRINSTGHTPNFGSEVEDTELVFSDEV